MCLHFLRYRCYLVGEVNEAVVPHLALKCSRDNEGVCSLGLKAVLLHGELRIQLGVQLGTRIQDYKGRCKLQVEQATLLLHEGNL